MIQFQDAARFLLSFGLGNGPRTLSTLRAQCTIELYPSSVKEL